MLGHLEVTAAGSGAEVIVLETGLRQPEAIALYESSGYEPVPSFGYYKEEPLSRCFGKRVERSGDDGVALVSDRPAPVGRVRQRHHAGGPSGIDQQC